MKIQEEKLLDITEKLKLQKENKDNAQNEVVNLKQEAEVCNKTIINLQEESKANFILIPELQSKIVVSKNVIVQCLGIIMEHNFNVLFHYTFII